MKWQLAPFRLDVVHTTGQNVVEPLPKTDSISALLIVLHGYLTVAGSWTYIDDTLFEVVKNGSEVIVSERYGPLVALGCFMGPNTPAMVELAAAGTGDAPFFIPFGRFPGDNKYFLNPQGFASLDLKITLPAGSGTVFTPTYSIYLLRSMDGVGSPQGYMKTHTLKVWTPTASTTDTIDLPIDYPYLAMMLSEIDGTSVDFIPVAATAGSLSKVRLNRDAGKIYPVDGYAKDIWFQNKIDSGRSYDAAEVTPVDYTNAVILNFVQPHDRIEPFPIDGVGSLKLEATWSTAVGPTRLTLAQLVS